MEYGYGYGGGDDSPSTGKEGAEGVAGSDFDVRVLGSGFLGFRVSQIDVSARGESM